MKSIKKKKTLLELEIFFIWVLQIAYYSTMGYYSINNYSNTFLKQFALRYSAEIPGMRAAFLERYTGTVPSQTAFKVENFSLKVP